MLQCPPSFFRILLAGGIVFSTSLGTAFAGDPTGDWRVADGVANIRVAECKGSMWGAVVWEKVAGGRDKNNPDRAKVNRPSLGMTILFDMKKKPGADEWNGKVYNGKDGQFYDSSIKVASPDQLEIQGCVLGFLCGGETWTRISGPIPSSPSNQVNGTKALSKANLPKMNPPVPPAAPNTVGQKTAATGQPADPVGDICLLPEIARPAH